MASYEYPRHCKYCGNGTIGNQVFSGCFVLWVIVMLQPFQYDPNEKNRHKFLVQTLVVPDDVAEIQESLVCT